MIAAVPATSPASVSEVWTGCFWKRSTAIPKTSRLNIFGSAARLLGARPDAQTLGERRRAWQDDVVLLGHASEDLDLGQARQPHADLAPAAAAARDDVEEALVAVAEHGRARDDERVALLPGHDLDFDRGVRRELPRGVRDVPEHFADLAALDQRQARRHESDLPLPLLAGKAVEGDD